MDEFITLIIFFVVIGLLERILRAAQKGKVERPTEGEMQAGDREAIEEMPASLQELIAEELGINLERKPKVKGLPEPPAAPQARSAPAEHPARRQPPAPAVQRGREPTVFYPSPAAKAPAERLESAGDRGAAVARRRREEVRRPLRAELGRPRAAPIREPLRDAERGLSLEERAILERGAPQSVERPRRPEDHQRFHERYMEEPPRPAARRSRVPLPEREDWSPAQKAIIWAEILGPPKGLDE
ncbi:MAG: hypothetical protein JSV86_10085 [Gemmatimonadota bacterium]|nr:MAG: hypothetical protein JSV86_10085 [Gemmatimonadota bacterium]